MPRPNPTTRRTTAALLLLIVLLVAAGPAGRDGGTTSITLLATNDFHNQLGPRYNPGGWDHGLGGAAWLAAHLDGVRERVPNAIHVGAGDMTGTRGSGFPIPLPLADEASIDVMGMMGLDVAVTGNHEYDRSTDHLLRVRGGGCFLPDDCAYRHDAPWPGADFETIIANVFRDTGERLFRPWTIRSVDGVEVGFVGITDISLIDQDDLLTARPYAVVNTAVEQVVEAGADVVVVLSHVGAKQNPEEQYDINGCENLSGPSARILPYLHDAVDVVIDGHTHHAYVCDDPRTPLLTQAGSQGLLYTELTLEYNAARDQVVRRSAVNRVVTHDIAPDPEVTERVAHYRELSRGTDAAPAADLDGDGKGDAYEVFWSWTDPRVAD